MKRFTLMIASTALGLALLAGAAHNVFAETGSPPDTVNCYYHMYYCSYDGDAYWSNCDSGYQEGWIPTGTAKVICGTYHSS